MVPKVRSSWRMTYIGELSPGQRRSPDDRQAMMQAAGGQFTELLTQHWKEDSTPPKWLWSVFQPVSTTPSAQVTQVNSPTARSSSRVAQNENNGGSSSPSLFFRQLSVPVEPSSPINPRNLNPEFSTPQQAQDSRTHRPSNPVALSTPLLINNSMPQDTPSMSGTPTLPRNNSMPDGTPSTCLLYTSPSPRDQRGSRMPSSA